jgi:ATP-dependent exoDNAse (exonuclease V) beta subunit
VSFDEPALEQDARARVEALDPSRSILLQAPAGSGKTTVLTARYLALLSGVEQPEEVLAVTFTRKAAAEMRHRVLAALRAAGSGVSPNGVPTAVLTAAAERNRTRGWDLLRNPSRLRIETIDALNHHLASRLPICARASPGLKVTADVWPLYRRAARRCLEAGHSDPDIGAATHLVFERLDNNWTRIENRLADMLQQRSHWLPRVSGADSEQLVGRIESSLLATLRAELAKAIAPLPAALLRESEVILAHSLRARSMARSHESVHLSAEPDSVAHWRALAALALTDQGKSWRKKFDAGLGFGSENKAMKARALEWRDALARVPGMRAALQQLGTLPDARLDATDRAALEALSRLLLRAAAELQLEFATSGTVDFSYVSGAARQALTEQGAPSELALRTGAAIRHILVDEFQDTSYEQLDLLRTLTADWEPGDGRTLFVVGDPMQSIYQFREAEVGLFLQARDHGIGAVRLPGLQLRQNFRSRETVIDWINAKFEQLFPAADDARLAAIRYLPSMSNPRTPGFPGPAVQLHAFADGDLAAEAEYVWRIVQQTREQQPQASIAVLVAARKHAESIVARLTAQGVAVRGVELEPLNERAVVRDLSALTRSLLHGGDRSAWLALLRAPWCGLTLAQLESLSADEQGDLFAHLLTRAASLSEGARQRCERVLQALQPAMTGEERALPLWQRVERCWLRLGGPAIHAAESDRLDAHRFLDALALHEDPESLAGEALSLLTASLYSSTPPQAHAVEVMTMHAAKGLEWDVVILPGLGRRTATTSDRLLHWIELPRDSVATDLLFAPIRATEKEPAASLAGYIKRLRRERSRLERVRLLYVSATRARQQLHLLGSLKEPSADSSAEPGPDSRSLLHVWWPAIAEAFVERYRAATAERGVRAAPPAAVPLRRLPDGWTSPEPPEMRGLERLSLVAPAVPGRPEYSWVGLTSRAVGTIVHAELHRLALTVPERGRDDRDYGAWLAELGVVDSGEQAMAARRISEALDRTRRDARGRWLLSAQHREARSEWRVSGVYQGRIVSVIFDRMLVDEHGQRWVIDYKTSTHQGGAIETFIEREAERYRPQMTRYAALATALDGRPVRAALYFPLLGVFRELQT